MIDYTGIAEEELKLRVAEDFFPQYDCAHRIGKIDFAVTLRTPAHDATILQSLLWAEAKRGTVTDIYKPLVQLVLTIGRARTFDTYLPPPFLGVFDAEKIVFLPYKEILPFFSLNDFNWNVTPSDDTTREFELLDEAIKATLDEAGELYLYRYDSHAQELRAFIQQHFSQGGGQIQVNKNNFVAVYQRWLATVQPSIAVDWALLKKQGIIDGDFFLADLLSEHNQTLKEALFVLLQDNRYVLDRKIDAAGLFAEKHVFFKDKQHAHAQFWSLYQRPPREEYWAYIIDRRDLLVPQDVRERKGSFFTPQQWVELSQQYIADVLGENWQEEYYVWDCAAGTGNLLNGLTNKYNIWASTLDPQDVQVMKDRIANGANLLESHVFQFDFLNDEFDKLPAGLQDIINDPQKRRKLVVYINPPYAEAPTSRTITGTGSNRTGITKGNRFNEAYKPIIGKAANELYALFLARIYDQIPSCWIGEFSTLKILQSSKFADFRGFFRAKLEKIFLVPADTFDNVNGAFPIGFKIWNTMVQCPFKTINADVYNENKDAIGQKRIDISHGQKYVISWLQQYYDKRSSPIGYLRMIGTDMQHNNGVYITNNLSPNDLRKHLFTLTTHNNLIHCCIYVTIRHCITHTWLNNQDQFLYPSDGWQTDTEFQTNCLAFTLFHGKNNIQSQYGINHWIPFTEAEVDAKERFESHFMTDFMAGKLAKNEKESNGSLFQSQSFVPSAPLVFSPEATAVFDAGRELWRYYHAQPDANPNASHYDIRAHFQGRNDKGKMNAKSDDAEYMRLLGNLKAAMEVLRQRIVSKVYEYGFLIE
ncbi:MAG: hypothetical protein ACTTKF_03720 [Bacteroides sp.]